MSRLAYSIRLRWQGKRTPPSQKRNFISLLCNDLQVHLPKTVCEIVAIHHTIHGTDKKRCNFQITIGFLRSSIDVWQRVSACTDFGSYRAKQESSKVSSSAGNICSAKESFPILVNDPNQLRQPIGYVCPKCNAELYGHYRPFCGECGKDMPPETKMQIVGLTIYPYQYGRPVRNIDDITDSVKAIGPTNYWLEEYHPSFRTTKIRIHTNETQQSDFELVCTGTTRLELPIGNGWIGIITVKQLDDKIVELSDLESNVLVMAGTVSLHTVART